MQARPKPLSSSTARQLATCGLLVLALNNAEYAAADPPTQVAESPKLSAADSEDDELLVLVDVNSQHLDETIPILRSKSGSIWVPEDSLKRWRLLHPGAYPKTRNGIVFVALDSITGTTYVYEPATLRLTITARPESFAPLGLVTGSR